MRTTTITPTGVERTFGADEIIVTKTDTRGLITYANDVFLRMSVYSRAEVLGRPHNLIRHPDMPRSVFKLLWDTIQGGSELFAYIVNLASDGTHYWVFAHVTPSYDAAGNIIAYHSNRRSPDRLAIATAADLYAELREAERGHASPTDAVAAGLEALDRRLQQLGQSYEELVWSITREEATC